MQNLIVASSAQGKGKTFLLKKLAEKIFTQGNIEHWPLSNVTLNGLVSRKPACVILDDVAISDRDKATTFAKEVAQALPDTLVMLALPLSGVGNLTLDLSNCSMDKTIVSATKYVLTHDLHPVGLPCAVKIN